jgi:dUTPase
MDHHFIIYLPEGELKYNTQDAGIDVPIPETITVEPNTVKKIDFKIKAAYFRNGVRNAYEMRPRSSLSKTTLLFRSGGLIDRGYTGNLFGAYYNFGTEPEVIEKGTYLFQLVTPEFAHDKVVEIQRELTYVFTQDTGRNAGGFGSTNK